MRNVLVSDGVVLTQFEQKMVGSKVLMCVNMIHGSVHISRFEMLAIVSPPTPIIVSESRGSHQLVKWR